ncbi:MAG: aspartate kinase [Verrucomicrobiota bacterium]|jgi:aspartate kinase|nr:aspartate kinase [Verrucomicrobiota bacterium]
MALFVQKYGGSSVADAECMRRVARRIYDTQKAGNQVVVVVSAMGDTTDELISLAKQVNPEPNEREMDSLLSTGEMASSAVLTMALHALGAKAISMTGHQAGIYVDGTHLKAKIKTIRPKRIQRHLAQGNVVVVAGFQGMNASEDVATLGRGGSDTTAVALAAALKADRCQILKDVDGVFTANPRVEPSAVKLDEITYDEMLELAGAGAEVLQSRAVEFAKNYGVVLEVLSSFEVKPGTVVREEVDEMEHIIIRGIAADKNQAKATLLSVPDTPGVAARIFKTLAAALINVDMIVQNVSAEGRTDLSFTVAEDDVGKTRRVLEPLAEKVKAAGFRFDSDIAKISLVGVGMKSHSGVAYQMFDVLAANKVNIDMISTSEIKISVAIRMADADKAVRSLHQAFKLGRKAAPKSKAPAKKKKASSPKK